MGKQTSVALSDEDEVEFLSFLRGKAEIQLLGSFAERVEDLWVDEFATREDGNWSYYIWNKEFEWLPRYAKTKDNRWYYIAESGQAPFIEYTRNKFSNEPGAYGRIYWAKYFSATKDLNYDVVAFERWYNQVVRWLRTNGVQLEKGAYNTYFLPGAVAKINSTS